MNIGVSFTLVVAGGLTAFMMLTAGWERPPMESEQKGYRGTGQVQIVNPREEAVRLAALVVPEAPYELESTEGPRASEVYENVQVLGDLSEEQFLRLMGSVTEWVSPEQGCNYCHNPDNLADDNVYTKVVSRRMFQMTRDINREWAPHVGATGVTCFTCHAGNPVPPEIWFDEVAAPSAGGFTARRQGQNLAAPAAGLTAMTNDPFGARLVGDGAIRVQAVHPLPGGAGGADLKTTETTYSLMIHMSKALGVNCTHCHNTQSFASWELSPPARATAWQAIGMVRALNDDYLSPLTATFPPERLGPAGDAPKLNCTTCHQGLARPLNGAAMVKDFPSLAGEAQLPK